MIAVVSHDAGGAEILSSWLSKCGEPYCLVLGGPAKAIFQRKLGAASQVVTLQEALKRCDWVLCGTSWQSSLERLAITQAKAVNKKVVSFLDHWVNYKERFQEQGEFVYPDEIWVGDVEAEKIAHTHFPGRTIVLKPNPYFQDLQLALDNVKAVPVNVEQCVVLYICEPIREHALLQHGDERYWGYTEEEALQYFINNINALGCSIRNIKIRPHPSENKHKYDWVRRENTLKIEIGGDKTLLEETAEADVVVGCESMAMVVGLMAKRRVISSIPPGGKPCSLPHLEIEHMQDLVASYKIPL
jgi:hypothetical protein